jgi:osmotically-inducible protein OsmY
MGKIRTLGLGALLGGGAAYAAKRLRPQAPGSSVDDVTLTQKVESELFRNEHEVKGKVLVNAADGVVQLRGEVERPDLIEELVQRARSVDGVRNVENLLHLPGEEAPMHQ